MNLGVFERENVDRFLVESDFAGSTQRVYEHALSSLTEFMKRSKLDSYPGVILQWKRFLRVSSATERLYVKTVGRFLNWAVDEGLIGSSPFPEKVHFSKKRVVNPREALTNEEVLAVMSVISEDKREIGYRDYAMFDLMLHTALRRASVAKIDLGDIEPASGYEGVYVLSYLGKGRKDKDQVVVVQGPVVESIRVYLRSGDPVRDLGSDGPLFLQVNHPRARLSADGIFRAVMARLGAARISRRGLSPHSLRHTAASKGLQAGADLKGVQEMLGHSKLETTVGYIHDLHRISDAAERRIDYGIRRPWERKKKRS